MASFLAFEGISLCEYGSGWNLSLISPQNVKNTCMSMIFDKLSMILDTLSMFFDAWVWFLIFFDAVSMILDTLSMFFDTWVWF